MRETRKGEGAAWPNREREGSEALRKRGERERSMGKERRGEGQGQRARELRRRWKARFGFQVFFTFIFFYK